MLLTAPEVVCRIGQRLREKSAIRHHATCDSSIVLTAPVARLALVGLVLVLGDPAVGGHDQVGPVRRGGVAVVFAVALHRAQSFRKIVPEILKAAVTIYLILNGSQVMNVLVVNHQCLTNLTI